MRLHLGGSMDRPHNIKQVIVMRKDLNMRKGKMTAQGSHSSMGSAFPREAAQIVEEDGQQFIRFPATNDLIAWFFNLSVKITVGIQTEQELMDIYRKAQEAGLPCVLIQDAGLTEFGGVPTYTAVGIGPARADLIDPITGNLPLL